METKSAISMQVAGERVKPDNKLSMVVFSGDMDKVMAAFIIATGAAASGMDVTMFFTFWGLKAIQKDSSLTGKGLFGRMLGLMNRGGIDTIGPSRFNFGGMGRWMMKTMMKQKNVASVHELRDLAIELGVKMMPCQMSMDVLEVGVEKMLPATTAPVGVAVFVEEAIHSKATLFI
jgi:peroxiredoxin family protein